MGKWRKRIISKWSLHFPVCGLLILIHRNLHRYFRRIFATSKSFKQRQYCSSKIKEIYPLFTKSIDRMCKYKRSLYTIIGYQSSTVIPETSHLNKNSTRESHFCKSWSTCLDVKPWPVFLCHCRASQVTCLEKPQLNKPRIYLHCTYRLLSSATRQFRERSLPLSHTDTKASSVANPPRYPQHTRLPRSAVTRIEFVKVGPGRQQRPQHELSTVGSAAHEVARTLPAFPTILPEYSVLERAGTIHSSAPGVHARADVLKQGYLTGRYVSIFLAVTSFMDISDIHSSELHPYPYPYLAGPVEHKWKDGCLFLRYENL